MVKKKIVEKDNLISIEAASTMLGFRLQGKMNAELSGILSEDYLSQFNLPKVGLDAAFINSYTGKLNKYCVRESDVLNKLKELKDKDDE